MIVTVFRSRLRPEAEGAYMPMAARMHELASAMPGYISHKTFVAEDGERTLALKSSRIGVERLTSIMTAGWRIAAIYSTAIHK